MDVGMKPRILESPDELIRKEFRSETGDSEPFDGGIP